VAPHPDVAGRESQAASDLGGFESFDVSHRQYVPIAGVEPFEPSLNGLAALLCEHLLQRVDGLRDGVSGVGREPLKGPRLTSGGQAAVLADVERRLKEKRRNRFGLLDAARAQRFQPAAQCFLGDVFRLGPVVQSPRREQTQAVPEPFEGGGFVVREIRQVRRGRVTPPLRCGLMICDREARSSRGKRLLLNRNKPLLSQS
jgi:hypothetical protein